MPSQYSMLQEFPRLILSEGKIIGYNEAFLELVNKQPRTILGKYFNKFIEHSLLNSEKLITPNYYLFFDESKRCKIKLAANRKIDAFLEYQLFESDQGKLVQLTLKPTNLLFKQNEELERYIHFYKQIAEILPDIAFIQLLNLQTGRTRFLYVNSMAEEVFGFTFEEIQQIESENDKAFFQFIHPDDREDHMYIVEEATKRKNIFSRVMKMFTKNRDVRYLYVNSSLFPINEGEVLSFGVARDITQLINQQKHITEQKEILQNLSEISNELISSFSTNLDKIADNLANKLSTEHFVLYLKPFDDHDQLLRTWGIKAVDIEPYISSLFRYASELNQAEIKTIPDKIQKKLNHGSDLQFFLVPIFKEKNNWGFFLFSKDATFHPTSEHAQFFNQMSSLLSLYLTQYEYHIAIENQFKTFSQILNIVDAVVLVADLDGKQVFFHNKSFDQLLKRKTEKNVSEILELLNHVITQKSNEFYYTPTARWYKCYTSRISWFQKGMADLIVMVDITDMKEYAQELENSKKLIETLVNNTPVGIMHLDTNGKLLYINDTYLRILNLNVADIARFQKAFNSIYNLPSLQKAGLVDDLKNVIKTGEICERALWLETLKGETKYMHYVIAPLKSEDGKVMSVIWVGQDLTQLKQMEEERQQLNLLDSLGLFSAGIAHDFNNLLTGIIGNLSLLKVLVQQGKYDRLLKYIEQAELSAEKSRDLTYQLLNYARGGVPAIGTTRAHSVTKNLTQLIFSGSSVQIIYELHAKHDVVDIPKVQFEQVINNLLTNAFQAMKGDGKLHLRSRTENLSNSKLFSLEKGEYFVLEIQDSGIGIDPQNIKKIFEPFYTTKSSGSGLGLAMVYSIIKKFKGHITVESEKNNGTTFTIYLPLAEENAEVEEATRILDRDEQILPGKILFMDDEEYICNIVREILSNSGHEVVTVKRGEDAIKSFKESIDSGKKFDVVILDLTIKGGLGGVETFQQLKQIDPDINAILTTGYTDEETIRKFREMGFANILQKPFTFEHLIALVQEQMKSV